MNDGDVKMVEETERTISLREIRSIVATKAREAEAWRELAGMLTEAGDLSRIIAGKQSEIAALEAEEAAARGRVETVKADGETLVAGANKEASDIIARAAAREAEAQQAMTAAKALLADAQSQAEQIIAEARAEADRIGDVAHRFASEIARRPAKSR